jgi:hypothetical protein
MNVLTTRKYVAITQALLLCVLLSTLVCSASANDASFQNMVSPFLISYCVSCHGPKQAKGEIRVDQLSGQMTDRKTIELWGRILESLEFGEMPSDKAKKFPTKAEARAVQGWIAGRLGGQGLVVSDKKAEEGFGNLVPHELLFSQANRNRPVDVAARLWRISPTALAQLLRNGGGVRMVSNPFALDKPHGNFRDFKGKYQLNSLMTEQLADLSIQAAKSSVKNGQRRYDDLIKKGSTKQEACAELLKSQYQSVLRRTPTKAELKPLLELIEKVDDELGAPMGMQAAFAAIILQPESVFRYEGSGEQKDKLKALTRREVAHALAFSLTDLPPASDLLKAFDQKDKTVISLVQSKAMHLLKNNVRTQNRMLQFFQEFFDYEKASDIFKDKLKGHAHWAPGLVSDLDLLVTKVLAKDKQVFKTLLTTREYYILVRSHRDKDSPLAYNLSPDFKPAGQAHRFPDDQRMGVLTHPAWLVAHSGNFDNDPIRRGLWIRKKLLGGNVADVPINVDAKLPDDKTMTLRQRMHVTRKDECYKCHSKMNPLGLPFERFDHFGRFRVNELEKPVDTNSVIVNTGVGGVDGKVKSPFELIEKLASSTHVEQVCIRHVFRFIMGRNETLGDAKALQDAHHAYVKSDGSMNALVVSLLSSDSFLYRAKGSSAPPAK